MIDRIRSMPVFIEMFVSLQSNIVQRIFNFRWFCHFDDDNYVNIHRLQQFLSDYDASLDWYIGKPSTGMPLEISPNEVSSLTNYWRSANNNNGHCHVHVISYENVFLISSKRSVERNFGLRLAVRVFA